MTIRHIYLFSYYSIKGISARYRGVYVLRELYKYYGISGTFIYPGYKPHIIIRFFYFYLKLLILKRKDSIIIYQKLYSRGLYTLMLKLLVKLRPERTIYDTDDADYLRYFDRNIYFFMNKCQLCTVGSMALKKFAEKYNDNVLLLTSPVVWHEELKKEKNPVLHLGWIGDYGLNKGYTSTYSHKRSLNEIIFPVLKELDFTFRFTILGIKNSDDSTEIRDYFKDKANIKLNIPENINWLDESAIYRVISDFDIGLSPMIDHDFNIAKSAFKVKQYLSCGVPVLASPVGENPRFVKDEVNGFLCNEGIDFKKRIIQFNEMTMAEYENMRIKTSIYSEAFSMETYCKKLFIAMSS